MSVACNVSKARDKVGENFNRRKGKKVKLRIPKGIPADVWKQTYKKGEVVEEVPIEYKSKLDPNDIWKPVIQAVKFRDGCLGLRFIHYKQGRPIPRAMINYGWLIDEFEPLVNKTSIIKDLLKHLIK
jgi:hypothetical protein